MNMNEGLKSSERYEEEVAAVELPREPSAPNYRFRGLGSEV